MKKSIIYTICSAVLLLVITACSSDSDEPTTTNTPIEDVTSIITTAKQGQWRVTKYLDHSEDKTSDFDGYAFTFGEGNVLTATNGTKTYTGSWEVKSTNLNNDDSPEDSVDFIISFPIETSSKNFNDITDDWDIITISEAKMELIDDLTKPATIDYLTFEKIAI